MNPSFFIPENSNHVSAAEALSPLSPTPNPFLKPSNQSTYSPRVYQRQAKIKINSLDFKRNSDHTYKINSTVKEAAEKREKGDDKLLNAEAVKKLSKGSNVHSSSTNNIFRRVHG